VDVGNNSLGGCNIVLKIRNDDVGVGNDGVHICDIAADAGNDRLGVQNITMDIRNGYIRVYCKLGLGVSVSGGRAGVTPHTLKT